MYIIEKCLTLEVEIKNELNVEKNVSVGKSVGRYKVGEQTNWL